jgi:hypothetical protein
MYCCCHPSTSFWLHMLRLVPHSIPSFKNQRPINPLSIWPSRCLLFMVVLCQHQPPSPPPCPKGEEGKAHRPLMVLYLVGLLFPFVSFRVSIWIALFADGNQAVVAKSSRVATEYLRSKSKSCWKDTIRVSWLLVMFDARS